MRAFAATSFASKRSVRNAAGRGKTLNVISASAPNRPALPTKNFGRSKPAAFFTTVPPQQPALAVDELHAEDEIPQAAEPPAARAAQSRGHRPAERRTRVREHGIEGQILAALGQRRDDLFQRRAGERGEREFARLVFDDAAQLRGGDAGELVANARQPRLRARADDDDARRRANRVRKLGGRRGTND
jgi:hypothetical protein